MTRMRKPLLGAGLVAAMAVGGAFAPSLFSAGAATTTQTATTAAPTATHKSNEATSHETSEDPTRESAENNGTATFGDGGGSGSNEATSHESGEGAAREAGEKNGTPPAQAPSSSTAPAG
jgi:hypothetical protein